MRDDNMAASEARITKKRKHGKAFSKKQDHEEDEENELRLEDVIGLGGTKVSSTYFGTLLLAPSGSMLS